MGRRVELIAIAIVAVACGARTQEADLTSEPALPDASVPVSPSEPAPDADVTLDAPSPPIDAGAPCVATCPVALLHPQIPNAQDLADTIRLSWWIGCEHPAHMPADAVGFHLVNMKEPSPQPQGTAQYVVRDALGGLTPGIGPSYQANFAAINPSQIALLQSTSGPGYNVTFDICMPGGPGNVLWQRMRLSEYPATSIVDYYALKP